MLLWTVAGALVVSRAPSEIWVALVVFTIPAMASLLIGPALILWLLNLNTGS